jgi:DNA-binding MarR family transcriptional regulator
MSLPAPETPSNVLALAAALRPLLLRIGRQLRREANTLGLSPLDAALLQAIFKNEGIGVSELAELEQTSKPTMSSHVKRLEAGGWVRRLAPSQADRRRVGLSITTVGRKALEAVRRRRTDWLAARLAKLSPEARADLEAALSALASIGGERS